MILIDQPLSTGYPWIRALTSIEAAGLASHSPPRPSLVRASAAPSKQASKSTCATIAGRVQGLVPLLTPCERGELRLTEGNDAPDLIAANGLRGSILMIDWLDGLQASINAKAPSQVLLRECVAAQTRRSEYPPRQRKAYRWPSESDP